MITRELLHQELAQLREHQASLQTDIQHYQAALAETMQYLDASLSRENAVLTYLNTLPPAPPGKAPQGSSESCCDAAPDSEAPYAEESLETTTEAPSEAPVRTSHPMRLLPDAVLYPSGSLMGLLDLALRMCMDRRTLKNHVMLLEVLSRKYPEVYAGLKRFGDLQQDDLSVLGGLITKDWVAAEIEGMRVAPIEGDCAFKGSIGFKWQRDVEVPELVSLLHSAVVNQRDETEEEDPQMSLSFC